MKTIAAIATPIGEGALGVIRISGSGALAILKALARFSEAPSSHRVYLRHLVYEGELLDEGVVLFFKGPRSFTGEDVVELQCHGGWVGLRRVLDAVLALGARAAEPGEFSRRALLNGKLDLVQVEAIADVIHARSEAAHRLALTHLAGRLSQRVDEIKSALARLLAMVEAAIDFAAEEHVYTIEASEIHSALAPIEVSVTRLLETYDAGRMQHEGVRVAIVGRPNAGKSTLLNHLLQTDRAMVSEIPGTTRDYLEESVSIGGVLFRIVDTAGLRDTEDRLEALGVKIAVNQALQADIMLVVVDAQTPGDLAEVRKHLPDRPYAVIWSKSDLGSEPREVVGARSCYVSFKTKVGVGALEPLLVGLARDAGLRADEDTVLITRARHRGLLLDARSCLKRGAEAAGAGMPHEFVAQDLREGLDALGALTGAITSDDILGSIFGEFCVGK